ncbi:hypothetical protein I2I11_15080 [Pontibacter sp. 172403-2]|uniref:hypothetical protein n=1 Tax=Pontibacter rufus TaxID=2791028 RepID=UPI0018AFA598|nr:hypothetical protein [Pontibacter sp. 172403-2]MBF9254626.1 hypothetical protein [Pontibacter sp. 172403-2]
MKHYTLQRFVKLNLYFFVLYSLLTAAWYAASGRFAADATLAAGEIVFNAAIFSLLFSLSILVWYRRAAIQIPVKELSIKQLNARLEELGYRKLASGNTPSQTSTYKPAPPGASVFAGKVFVQKKADFYLIEGPARYVKRIQK